MKRLAAFLHACAAVMACAALLSCVSDVSSLPASPPDQEGLSAGGLEALAHAVRTDARLKNIDSMLIVRNGRLILEEYFNGYKRESLHTIQSVTKSFTSALIGIAVNEGALKSVDQRVLSFFPDSLTRDVDSRKAAMTIRDILTMRTGTDYAEGYPGSPHDTLNSLRRGWDTFYLDRPMIANPGERFQYDSGGVILLSSILKNSIGVHADVYAARKLFPLLEIRSYRWYRNADGHPHTGGGLFLRPMDMAKLGLLYLQDGKWNGVQVVPEAWVKESVTRQVSFKDASGFETGYGYLWWILKPDPRDPSGQPVYAAYGYMGQYVFVVPAYRMVVVFTGSAKDAAMDYPKVLLYEEILPLVCDAPGSPAGTPAGTPAG